MSEKLSLFRVDSKMKISMFNGCKSCKGKKLQTVSEKSSFEEGFAIVKCDACGAEEELLALTEKQAELCGVFRI